MNQNIPLQKVFVRKKFLNPSLNGLIDGYWYGIATIPTHMILCHVTLKDGSNWARLPLHALITKETAKEITPHESCMYDCFSYKSEVIVFSFLKGQKVRVMDVNTLGHYVFTIDYLGNEVFAEFPEQYKQHHVIECEDGNFRARPNNFLCFLDEALYEPFVAKPPYKRMKEFYSAET